jgi:hypothetical protein
VLVDRVNIAGNETGQQSNFQSKGTRPQDAVWTMDGVVITDMAAVGVPETIAWYRSNGAWLDRVRSGAYREYYQRQYGPSGAPQAAPRPGR